MMLMVRPPWVTAVFLARMVMPFSRSRSPESSTRSATCALARNAPDCHSIASTSVVLPWSTCATIATLRRSSRVATAAASSAGLAGMREDSMVTWESAGVTALTLYRQLHSQPNALDGRHAKVPVARAAGNPRAARKRASLNGSWWPLNLHSGFVSAYEIPRSTRRAPGRGPAQAVHPDVAGDLAEHRGCRRLYEPVQSRSCDDRGPGNQAIAQSGSGFG